MLKFAKLRKAWYNSTVKPKSVSIRRITSLEPRPNETFSEWFARLGVKHFKAYEIENYFLRSKNTEPPRELWGNFIPVIKLIDSLREALGVPIIINSTYRSDAYNKSVGGARYSQHKNFCAIDFVVAGHSPSTIARILRKWRDQDKKFLGGVGEYRNFVHVDTRGEAADW